MQFDNSQHPPAAQTGTATARPGINIPSPAAQMSDQTADERALLQEKHEVKPLEPTRYLRERISKAVHKYSPEFGARSDLMENYHPSLIELVRYKESPYDLMQWGYLPEQLLDAGVSLLALSDALVAPQKLHELGASLELLKSWNHDVAGLEAPAPAPAAPAAPAAPKKAAPKMTTLAPAKPKPVAQAPAPLEGIG